VLDQLISDTPRSEVPAAGFARPAHAACWTQAIDRIAAEAKVRGLLASRIVVLLPYFQLLAEARQAWVAHLGRSGEADFLPRFETTLSWAANCGVAPGPFIPGVNDLRMDAAIDRLTADSLLRRASLGAHREVLAGRLAEAAVGLARVAAAVRPAERLAWGESLGRALQAEFDSPALALESAIGRIALAWASASSYPTDRLFGAEPGFLMVVEGFQPEPLSAALLAHFGARATSISLSAQMDDASGPARLPALHATPDAEDEAVQAAACVLAHLSAGRSPVALVAQDRRLTRRVGAMLQARGVAMRDETGWKLSTTRAAATVMSLLRAAARGASADEVIAWLKNAPAFAATEVDAVESELRSAGLRSWQDLPDFSGQADGSYRDPFAATRQLAPRAQAVQAQLARTRPLEKWLDDLRKALENAGQWTALADDPAGQTVLAVLRLHEGMGVEFESAPSMTLAAFTRWVDEALEGASFSPPAPPKDAAAEVVILPLANLLGRSVQAVVLAGCDELHLPVAPEPPGQWTTRQRQLLGLHSRQTLAGTARAAWDYAMRLSPVDVLWRQGEAGEAVMPSGFVQELLLDHESAVAADRRVLRKVWPQPTPRPQPTGEALPVMRLSASAYEDLRRCPYRFFALRQLKLQEPDELDSEIGKRDFGNWLHHLLKRFHEKLKEAPAQEIRARVAMINIAADEATRELGLSDSEFLPFAAIWPRVRDGYLEWLAVHESRGARFDSGEVWREMRYGDLTLVGQLDRIEDIGGETLLIDYKSEPRSTTSDRIKRGGEDTQLAFYAALTEADTLQAAYVNLGEKEPTKTYPQPDIVQLRDDLIDSILTDMARITRGAALPALGEGKACEYCAARGMCRKDFWE
jgi:ATP-dependent helicase/nuclease subunit B